jgi:hypothetical protein
MPSAETVSQHREFDVPRMLHGNREAQFLYFDALFEQISREKSSPCQQTMYINIHMELLHII